MLARLACAFLLASVLPSSLAAGSRQAEWVVVPADTKLYMHPDPSALLAEAEYGGGGYLTFRKAHELPAGWTEVETVCDSMSAGATSCDYNLKGVWIRLFVRNETFLRVLQKRMKLRLANGRFHVFLPGTPVVAGSEPGQQVARALDGSSAAVPAVPAVTVGRDYKAAQYSKLQPKPGSPVRPIFDRSSALGNHLPAQTRLYWRDGSVAGQLMEDYMPDCEVEKRPCLHHRIGKFSALLCGDEKALDNVGAAMKEAFQKPQGEPP